VSERWTRIGEIFDAATRLRAEERAAFVAVACAGDGELESDVRSLLAHHDAAAGFLEPEPRLAPITRGGGESPGSAPSPPLPAAGQMVGAWRVVRPLAEGGMGVVYLVEREDGQFRQRGALKIIR
jgi:serine/threonine-protein kinase